MAGAVMVMAAATAMAAKHKTTCVLDVKAISRV